MNYALKEASRYGEHQQLIELLLTDPRVDPSYEENSAIKRASAHGEWQLVQVLLSDSRVDPSTEDNYPIRRASENGKLEVVELLLSDPRVDPSACENEAIRNATKSDIWKFSSCCFQIPEWIHRLAKIFPFEMVH
jgi:hypothetical protein